MREHNLFIFQGCALERLVAPLTELASMTRDERTNAKWATQMQPVKVWMLAQQDSSRPASVVVLNWARVNMDEMASMALMPPATDLRSFEGTLSTVRR